MKSLHQKLYVALTLILTLYSYSVYGDMPPYQYNDWEINAGVTAAHQHHYKQAVKDFKEAVNNNLTLGYYDLGLLYTMGEGVPESNEKAIYYLKHAAQNDYAPAMVHLGSIYHDIGEIKKTKKWYLEASYSSNGKALQESNFGLGLLYYKNPHYKNNKKAIQYFRDAASLHYIPALYYLGLMNFYGQATPKNYQRAYNLFMAAKRHGVEGAQQGLNCIYFVLTIPQIKQLQQGKFNMSELIKRH